MTEIPEWRLERMARGEMPAPNDDETKSALARLRASNEQILRDLPPETVAAEVERRWREPMKKSPSRTPWVVGFALSATAAL